MRKINDVNILSRSKLPSPAQIRAEMPMSTVASERVFAHRQAVFDILEHRDKRHILIVGPCSIHDPEAALDYARKLKSLSDAVGDKLMLIMRVYFEKPRTTVGWKGLIYDPDLDGAYNIEKGIRLARRLILDIVELGLPVATETLDPILVQYIAEAVSWTAIGARTTESQPHRQLASGLSMAVGFKNATDGNMQVAIDAVKTAAQRHSFIGVDDDGQITVFRTGGNPYGHIVLRGGPLPNYGAEYIAFLKVAMRKAAINPAIIVDCSHANSAKDFHLQRAVFTDVIEQIAAGETALVGTMLESNLVEGSQPSGGSRTPRPDISITDGCIGFDETVELVQRACERLGRK